MFCKKCGAELADDALFCSKCGTAVEQGRIMSKAQIEEEQETERITESSAEVYEDDSENIAQEQISPQAQGFSPDCVIRDIKSILVGIIAVLFFFFSLWGCIESFFSEGKSVGPALVSLILFIFFVIWTWGEIRGYQIDLKNRILWAPPGKAFGIFREYINIDDIQSISGSNETRYSENRSTGRISALHTYKLQIIGAAGTFGSRRYSFFSEAKRDELYSAIAELNNMGTPIV